MKLISVEFIEESEASVFFNATYETGGYWSKSFEITRRAYFVKPHK